MRGASRSRYFVMRAKFGVVLVAVAMGLRFSPESGAIAGPLHGSNASSASVQSATPATGPAFVKPATIVWPGDGGFLHVPRKITLYPGTAVDRYGAGTGTYVSPAGTPFSMRGLPPSYQTTERLTTYRVLQPISVESGRAAPAFGLPGLGIQYELPTSVDVLIGRKALLPVDAKP